jgi:3-deoxy-D-manno-octulosonate 8-phosphate phosphatase (KDO 8-P phosphatase)
MSVSQGTYENLGGEFLVPLYKISEKLQSVKAFVFDWDGVFNDGVKQANGSSSFNEIDSMGTNLLRFSYFLRNKKAPVAAIISGEKNETAFFFSRREHFHKSYYKVADKRIALKHLCDEQGLKLNEICYFFDDVLDLPVASAVGLRIFIPRKATPLFTQYVKQNHLADYLTGSPSGQYAVREACEMLMAAYGVHEQVISLRMNFDDVYKQYIAARNDITTHFYTLSNGQIGQSDL